MQNLARLIRCRQLALSGAALLTLSCSSDQTSPSAPERIVPAVISSSVAQNSNNTISAVVTAEVDDADRARVTFGRAGILDEATPTFRVEGARTIVIPVLGLFPETDYTMQVVAISITGDTVIGSTLSFRTGRLPDGVINFETFSSGVPAPGYTMIAPQAQMGSPPAPLEIVDNSGRVVWYKETTGAADFQPQPNGHYTAAIFAPAVPPLLPALGYEELDVLGNVVHTWSTPGFITDLHEIRLLDGGNEALLLGFVSDTFDLTEVGVSGDGAVVGNVLQRVTRGGSVVFQWNSLEHYRLNEALDFLWQFPGPAGFDLTHSNAVELDSDGHYLLSARHFSEITKISAATGKIIWRMGGGKANQFTFLGDPHNGFHMPHSIRRLDNGHLLMIDNGNFHSPPSSRAVEYEIDEAAKTATMVWSFEPGIFSCCMGFAQRLSNGNTLVNLGEDHRVFEVSTGGNVVWELRLPNDGTGYFGIYRAIKIPSLYGLIEPALARR